jgi:hypothetical protein
VDVHSKIISMENPVCPHCTGAHLVVVSADEPWHNEHYQCPKCDSTYNHFDFENVEVVYDWIVKDEDGKSLAYQIVGEEPVMIYPEKALLKCIETIKTIHKVNLNTQHLLADLSRLL